MRRNQLTGPGFASVDLSVLKNIPVTERLKAQFRVEMFKIFNRRNLAPPSGYLFGGFGQSTDTIGDYNGAPEKPPQSITWVRPPMFLPSRRRDHRLNAASSIVFRRGRKAECAQQKLHRCFQHQQWCSQRNRLIDWDRGRIYFVCVPCSLSLALQRSPSHVALEVLPEALQSPDHVQLPIRKVFEEAVAHQSRNILPIVISLVSQFFLQHRSDGNNRRKSVSEEHELKKERPTQGAKESCC